jgi:hypothetical protein
MFVLIPRDSNLELSQTFLVSINIITVVCCICKQTHFSLLSRYMHANVSRWLLALHLSIITA